MELQEVEGLLNEFYSGRVTNQRIQEIQRKLDEFGSRPDSMHNCLALIRSNPNNHFVFMYALSIIEHGIQKRWPMLSLAEKEEIKSSLMHASRNSQAPPFIKNKVVKLVVDIAKFAWPADYPEFFDNIFQLCSDPQTVMLGLLFLKSAIEEFSSSRENVTFERKRELLQHFCVCLPKVTGLLKDILEAILRSQNSNGPPIYNEETKAICTTTFQTLNQIVVWVPSTVWVTPELTNLIFRFVPVQEADDVHVICARYAVASDAMSVMNEIVSKPYTPEAADLVSHMIQSGFQVLELLLTPGPTGETVIAELDEGYLSKFTDFILTFVQNHLLRYLHTPGFNVESFFFLLYRFTQEQTASDSFISSLEFWEIILAIFSNKLSEKSTNKEELLGRFEPVFMAVCDLLLKKLQYAYNEKQIESMIDDLPEEGQESVWQIFLKNDIEILFGIANLYHDKVTTLVEEIITSLCKEYMSFEEKYITPETPTSPARLKPMSNKELTSVLWVAHDLTAFVQLAGRFSDLFVDGEAFQERKANGLCLFTTVLEAASYGSKAKLYVPFAIVDLLRQPMVQLHAESLGCLRAWCPWLSLYQSSSSPDSIAVKHLVTSFVTTCTSVLSPDSPKDVASAAASTVASMTVLLRSKFVSEMSEVGQLFADYARLRTLSFETYILVTKSLFNILVLPWYGVAPKDQLTEERSQKLNSLLQTACYDYISLARTPGVEQNSAVLKKGKKITSITLRIIGELMCEVINEATPVKTRVYEALRPYILDTKFLAMVYAKQHGDLDVLQRIMHFFVLCFECLQQQMGYQTSCDIIETLLEILGTFPFNQPEQFGDFIEGQGTNILEFMLTIVEFAVRGSSKEYKKLLPPILSLCLDSIYPSVAQRPGPEVKVKLLCVLGAILLNHWRYFFGSAEELENPEYFFKIMSAFGQAFLQPDMQVFQESLRVLRNLNSKWNLFHKEVFVTNMLSQFMVVLLQVLLAKTHDLLRDEISQAIYDLAAVDFNGFFNGFLPEFSKTLHGMSETQKEGLVRSFRRETDLPTFVMNLERFIVDSRCFFVVQQS